MKPASLACAVALVLSAAPAFAQAVDQHTRVATALRNGCKVQQVHTPAGKLVHSAPIIRCTGSSGDVARRGGAADERQGASRAPVRVDVAAR